MPHIPSMDATSDTGSITTPAQRKRAFGLLFWCLAAVGAGNSIVFAVLPPLASEIGLTNLMVSAIYVVPAVFYSVMSQVWGSVSDSVGRRPIMLMGLTAAGLSMFAFAAVVPIAIAGVLVGWAATGLMILTRIVFAMFGSGTPAASAAYVADRTSVSTRTAAIATVTAGFGLGTAVGPVFEGALAPYLGLTGPLYIAAALTLTAAVAVRSMLPERTPPKPRADEPEPERVHPLALAVDPRLTTLTIISVVMWIVQGAQLQTLGFFVIARTDLEGNDIARGLGWVLSSGSLAFLAMQIGGVRVLSISARTATIVGILVMTAGCLILATSMNLAAMIVGFMVASGGAGLSRAGQAGLFSLAVTAREQGAAAGLSMATAGVGFMLAPFAGMLLLDDFGPASPYWTTAALSLVVMVLALGSQSIRSASAKAQQTEDVSQG